MVSFLLLLLPFVLASSEPRQTTSPSVVPDGWTGIGCYTDTGGSRTLNAFSYQNATMTVATCVNYCAGKGAHYAGTEYGTECYCDSDIRPSGVVVAGEQCNMPCGGNVLDICGAGNRLSVYWDEKAGPSVPETVDDVWEYQGCYADSLEPRSLSARLNSVPDNAMTIQACTRACNQAGYSWAGLEYAKECWCGNSMLGAKVADTDCRKTCTGNLDTYCGGDNRLTVYKINGTTTPEPDPQKCTSSNNYNFNMRAVYRELSPSGPASVSINAYSIQLLGKQSTYILSQVNSKPFPFYNISNNQLFPSTGSQYSVAWSYSVRTGESPIILWQQYSGGAYSGYCQMASASGTSLLAANGHSDLWSLCTNTTREASRRLDVIFNPVPNHPHYYIDDCQPVTIEMY